MARPTRDDGIVQDHELTKGMKVFKVISKTIVDSTGAYCVSGQQAALNKADATHYHKLNLIQVGLPDFDEPKEGADAGQPASGEGAKAAAAAGSAASEGGSEFAADGAGGRTSRRV